MDINPRSGVAAHNDTVTQATPNRKAIAAGLLDALLALFDLSRYKTFARSITEIVSEGVADGDRALSCPGDATLAFGITEFSLSYCGSSPATVRALAEVLTRRVARPEDVCGARDIGMRALELLSWEGACDYHASLFQDIFDLTYEPVAGGEQQLFRFGLALQLGGMVAPALKCYFDLHTTGVEHSRRKLAQAFERLGAVHAWHVLDTLSDGATDMSFCRGLALDLTPGGAENLRVYMPGREFTTERIRELIAHLVEPEQLDAFDLLRTVILGRPRVEMPLRSVLVSVVFPSAAPDARPIVKVDVYLLAHKPDDKAACSAIQRLGEGLGIALPGYREAVALIANGGEESESVCIQQYVSLDLLPGMERKLNVYFRPHGLETLHMTNSARPRRKPANLSECDRAVRAAIAFLERERQSGYAEAVHRMIFPRAAGFTGPSDVHLGIVYQISLICCALLEAGGCGYEVDWLGIDSDVDRLVRMKCQDVRGGWKYFPSLPELPPDADDLAQILEASIGCERSDLSRLFDDSIELLLKGVLPDGGLSTWVIDRESPGAPEKRMLDAVAHQWGESADPEVMANVLYALWRYDYGRFRSEIAAGTEFLVGAQNPDGSWASTWYKGMYYGTFVCTRVLSATTNGNHHVLPLVAQFLTETQNEDGGWGDSDSNATDTALGLLTATLLRGTRACERAVVWRATEFLIGRQMEPGRWQGTSFIRMDTRRAHTVNDSLRGESAFATYRSDTVTSALCLSALCAARPILAERKK